MNRTTLAVAAAAAALVVSGGAAVALATNDGTGTPATVRVQPAGSTTSDSPTSTTSPTTSRSTSESTSDSPTPPTSVPAGAELTSQEAARIVLDRLGGGQVRKVEREVEHGRVEWKVEVTKDGTTYDIRVDALSGEVTRVDVDDRGRGGSDDRTDDRTDDRGRGGDDRGGDDHRGRGGDDDRDHDRGDDHGGNSGRGGDDSGNSGRGGGDDKGGDR